MSAADPGGAPAADPGGTPAAGAAARSAAWAGGVLDEGRQLWADHGTRRWAAGLVAATVVSTALAVVQANGRPILALEWALLILLGVWAVVWLAALGCVARLPNRRVVILAIIVAGTAMRMASLAGPPTLSDDLYRYSWDAQTQLHGIDPYRSPPDAAALRPLRGSWLWPDGATCADLDRRPGCTRINRPAVRTIYPPVAEAYFAAVYSIGGGMASEHKLWQVSGLLTEMATMALLARLLSRTGRDLRWLALYALCPLPVVEIVDNGHVDGLAVALLVAALLALGGRERPSWRPWACGALIGAAALVKLYPAVMLIPAWAAPGMTRRDRLRLTAGALAVGVAGYAPHVVAVGPKVLGYLRGYLQEEHYTGLATRFLLVGILHLPPRETDVVIVVVLVATAAWILHRRSDPALAATALMGALLLCATPVQPWYGVTLLALATAARRPEWTWVVLAGYPYFFAVILDALHVVGLGELSYAAGAALAVLTAATLRWSRTSRGSGPPGGPSRTALPAGAPR